ncbi:MAG: PQQ-dependent sugar dehydrogenase [Patescibacteria group bacterium]|jgi:glucose/arabinose dehydrogenase
MKLSPFARHVLAAFFVLAVVGTAYAYRNVIIWTLGRARWAGDGIVRQGFLKQDFASEDVSIVASRLEAPWALVFLPDGSLLISERAGRLRSIGPDGAMRTIEVPGVQRMIEGGLLGIAAHPEFSQNGWIYAYFTALDQHGDLKNRVERYRLEHDALFDRTTILQNIPAGAWGNGGAMRFGPDQKLYISTGDAGDESTAQDMRSFGGKILRVNDDGSTPKENPFGNAIWTYGHRNVEGFAWDDDGRLWATERGRSLSLGHDEVNLIEAGKNYGWPLVRGREAADGVTAPSVDSGREGFWSPSGAAWFDGSVFFGTLRGEALYEVAVDASPVSVQAHFETEFGRIRTVEVGPDGMFYLLTSNTDGHGIPKEGDDQLIRLNPHLFRERP